MNIIRPEGLPAPGGHYSHAVAHGGTLYVSGQLGRGPGLTDAEAGDIRVQTRRALAAITAILQAAGTDLAHVLKMNVYVSHIDLWPACNQQYAEILGSNRPARAIIPTGPLHYGALVEIDAIAALGSSPLSHLGA